MPTVRKCPNRFRLPWKRSLGPSRAKPAAKDKAGEAPREARPAAGQASAAKAGAAADPTALADLVTQIGSRASTWLTRSAVYQRVPLEIRNKLDEAILLRPAGCQSVASIAARFQLKERYGVSTRVLAAYAGRLERFIRPAMTSQVMAGVLGCLPERYRRQLVEGSQVLLVSRVIQALSDDESAAALSVAELAKLAYVLASFVGRARAQPRGGAGTAEQCEAEPDSSPR